MPKLHAMRWSGRSQVLLIQAVSDPAFVGSMQARGIPESYLRLWIAQNDVATKYRGNLRGWLEDWAHDNPHRTASIKSWRPVTGAMS